MYRWKTLLFACLAVFVVRVVKSDNPVETQDENTFRNEAHIGKKIRTGFENTPDGYEPIIGIDLGTTYCCATIVDSNGELHTIKDENDRSTYPSIVYFSPDGKVEVGHAAKQKLGAGDGNVLYGAKRLIGGTPGSHLEKFLESRTNDIRFDEVKKKFYMKISTPVTIKGEKEPRSWFTPDEVSRYVLMYIKDLAEKYTGRPIRKAVVTIPANFTNSQREATREAAISAGFEVEKLLHEPTAGSIAYGLGRGSTSFTAFVVDFGGGTADLSLVTIESDIFEVTKTHGNNFLGGDDIDSNGVYYLATEISKTHGVDLSTILGSYAHTKRLKSVFEEAKIKLSTVQSTDIELPEFLMGKDGKMIDCVITLSRMKLEEIAKPVVDMMIQLVRDMLRVEEINIKDIDDVIAIGGTTKMPYILKRLGEVFQREVKNTVSPDMAVGIGAGLQAYVMTGGDKKGAAGGILLLDVTGLTIGLGLAGDFVEPLIKRNTPIPCKNKKRFTTASDFQKKVELRVFEGERPETRHCNLLGTFVLDGIPPKKAGDVYIDVEFQIDNNGILHLTATEMSTGLSVKESCISVRNTSMDQVEKMVKDAERFKEEDDMKRQAMEAKREVENYARGARDALSTESVKKRIPEEKYKFALETIERTLKWCNTVSSENLTRDLCDEKHHSLRQVVDPLLKETPDGGADQKDGYQFDPSKKPTYGDEAREYATPREDL